MPNPYITPSYNRYPSGHVDPAVNAVVMVINDWFDALEAGEDKSRFPDPNYTRQWSNERVDELILAIDKEYNQEANGWARSAYEVTTGPEFFRLEPLQRLAFIQDLHRAVEANREALELRVVQFESHLNFYDQSNMSLDY